MNSEDGQELVELILHDPASCDSSKDGTAM